MRTRNNQLLYSVSETLLLLKIGRTKLYEEIAKGQIKALKSGQRTLIPAKSIKNWVNSLPSIPPKKHGG